jgi:hypothetical protein
VLENPLSHRQGRELLVPSLESLRRGPVELDHVLDLLAFQAYRLNRRLDDGGYIMEIATQERREPGDSSVALDRAHEASDRQIRKPNAIRAKSSPGVIRPTIQSFSTSDDLARRHRKVAFIKIL